MKEGKDMERKRDGIKDIITKSQQIIIYRLSMSVGFECIGELAICVVMYVWFIYVVRIRGMGRGGEIITLGWKLLEVDAASIHID